MTAIETLERSISKLETLRDEACGLPWTSTDQSPSMDGRNWVIRTEGVAGMRITAHDYGHYGNVELIVALSRTVEPMLDMLRHAHEWLLEGNNAAVVEGSSVFRAQITPELDLARAILGEENDHDR